MAPIKPPRRSVHFSPKHTWRDQDRLTLALLDLCFNNHAKEYADIFSHMHQEKLVNEGFEAGMPASSLVAQLYELKNGGTGSRLFNAIRDLSLNQLRATFADQLTTIEAVARRVRVLLIPRSNHDTALPQRSAIARRQRAATMTSATSVTTWHPDPDEVDEHYTPTRASRLSKPQPGTNEETTKSSFLPAMTSAKLANGKNQRHPYFLYRAFEVDHGLVARRYVGSENSIPIPPRFTSRLFEHEVQPHLNRDKSYSSPFLSFSQNPAVAIKHAFNRTCNGRLMALAIMKYDDLERDAIARFGPDSGPYLTPVVCTQHELFDLPGTYTGTGEFLVWGSVNCQPVIVITSFYTLMCRAVLRTTFKIDAFAGTRLNRYLPRTLKPEYMELFIYQLITGFRVPGHKRARKSLAYLELLQAATKDHEQPAQTTKVPLTAWESDSDSDVEIVAVRPCRRTRFAIEDWRSDTTSRTMARL